jgi:hypothetical protein
MKIAPTALITMALLAAAPFRAETLANVLAANKIPVNLFPAIDLQQPITSYAVSAGNLPFLLAYYDDDHSGILPEVLHVIRYDGHPESLRRADLHGTDDSLRAFLSGGVVKQVMKQVSNECMGSALAIAEEDGFITINTHINPSAGCILILKSDLSFSAGLWGWTLARIDGNIILEGNTTHFAPTHPATLSIYDPRQKQLTQIYPSKTDAERQLFSAELQKHLPSIPWCRETNHRCDPEYFSTDIGHITVSRQEHSFEFDAQMTSEGFGEKADQVVKPRTVHYTCTQKDGKWLLTSEAPPPSAPSPAAP